MIEACGATRVTHWYRVHVGSDREHGVGLTIRVRASSETQALERARVELDSYNEFVIGRSSAIVVLYTDAAHLTLANVEREG